MEIESIKQSLRLILGDDFDKTQALYPPTFWAEPNQSLRCLRALATGLISPELNPNPMLAADQDIFGIVQEFEDHGINFCDGTSDFLATITRNHLLAQISAT